MRTLNEAGQNVTGSYKKKSVFAFKTMVYK